MAHISIQDIIDYVQSVDQDIKVNHNWGEKGLFYNPKNLLPKGVYLLTFKEKDGPNDKASNVNRDGVYRLNLGISKPAFINLFDEIPKRPAAGQIVDTGHDFQALNKIMPHPVYGWMAWVGVLNPSAATFEKLKPLINESIEMAKVKFRKKIR